MQLWCRLKSLARNLLRKPQVESQLAIFELEKALYELRYELDNRPEWVAIPVAGITRIVESV